MKNHHFLNLTKTATVALLIFFTLSQCSEEQLNPERISNDEATDRLLSMQSGNIDCSSCTYVVPANTTVIDGKALGLAPGSIIGLDASVTYGYLVFKNIVGTPTQPIIIKNCGGT